MVCVHSVDDGCTCMLVCVCMCGIADGDRYSKQTVDEPSFSDITWSK